jgi:uncharacterized membrane protein
MFTATLTELLLATIVFVGGHFVISSTGLRPALVKQLGEKGYQGLFSLLMGLALAWMIVSYARAPMGILWPQTAIARYLPLVMMPFALILVVGGLRPDNPTMVGGSCRNLDRARLGIFAITRHPFLWGVTLWAVSHLAPNGDVKSLVLMGGVLVLSLGGTFAIDSKTRRDQPEDWQCLKDATSNLPFAAIAAGRAGFDLRSIGWVAIVGGLAAYALLLWLHPLLFGVSPLPG